MRRMTGRLRPYQVLEKCETVTIYSQTSLLVTNRQYRNRVALNAVTCDIAADRRSRSAIRGTPAEDRPPSRPMRGYAPRAFTPCLIASPARGAASGLFGCRKSRNRWMSRIAAGAKTTCGIRVRAARYPCPSSPANCRSRRPLRAGRLPEILPSGERVLRKRFTLFLTVDILRDCLAHDPVRAATARFGKLLNAPFQLIVELDRCCRHHRCHLRSKRYYLALL